jgi:hypothetical protein
MFDCQISGPQDTQINKERIMDLETKVTPTVRIMRSHDYCHFELTLTPAEPIPLSEVDSLRKAVATHVDEAVRQYKIAKAKEWNREGVERQKRDFVARVRQLEEKAKSEPLTPEEAAIIRADADKTFWANFSEDDYCYCDPEREHHFSMLSKFKELMVKCD